VTNKDEVEPAYQDVLILRIFLRGLLQILEEDYHYDTSFNSRLQKILDRIEKNVK